MIVLGLIGERGAGKGAFYELIIKNFPDKRTIHLKFSDILGETLALWYLTRTRENYSALPIIFDKAFGEGTFSRAVGQRITAIYESYPPDQKPDLLIADGLRWNTDVSMFNNLTLESILLYITADVEVRWKRAVFRKEKAGEENTTLEEFRQGEKTQNEISIPCLGRRYADFIFENNGSLNEFERDIIVFAQDFLNFNNPA